MQERQRQSVGVVLTLVGVQDTAVTVQHAGTPEASVAVRLGKALIYLNDRPTANALAFAWNDLARDARLLPREISSSLVAPLAGMAEPAVLIEAGGLPPMLGRVERPVGAYPHLRLVLGRVMFSVRDLGAYSSTTAAFRRAADCAVAAFPGTGRSTARQHASDEASRLFVAPRAVRRTSGREPGPMAPRVGPTNRITEQMRREA
ncbi:hypothetical protein GCM10017691_38060 [Pseudonocardia petroleophila]|uniref:Uncharacterized protein n=2 Tax=Pseudonocardia petroleophila TaxID=37331 RepID=A0A7G7MCD9_9PSEU|nr:hypothetical protein [Pseudonocardia petroleophila]QNG50450.1 hypothetical protein H6H00_19695 [Pseudonocardia petroleophila]